MKGKTMITNEAKIYQDLQSIWLFITIVERYFELKAKGITTEAEALEHRELLNKINEMVGIEE
jgi:hypothetical protein